MPSHCEVLVIGGGPAGTATALGLLFHGLSTLVAEKTRYESANPGETLLGDTYPILRALGVLDRFVAGRPIAASPVTSVWGSPAMQIRPTELEAHPPAWQVDRAWFDPMLARAAEGAGALVYCGISPRKIERTRRGWRVTLKGRGTAQTVVNTGYLVDATGRAAWLARRMGSGTRRMDRLVGLVASYAHAPTDNSLLVEAGPEGWWYSVPLATSRAIAVYLTDADLIVGKPRAALFGECLGMTSQTGARLESLGEPTIRVVAADTSARERCAGERWLAVGDAAFCVDPLSGSGIRRALETGLHAAEIIVAAMRGRRGAFAEYGLTADERFASQLRVRAHYYGLERRWPSSTFWRRRH